MKKKVKFCALSAVAVTALLCLFRYTSSYFVDTETAVNVIKIGKISVELTENFTPPENALPGRIFEKAPKLINNGTKDEFVFLKITVPKERVTLLYETNTVVNEETKKAGTIRKAKDTFEIFRMMADNSDEHPVMKLQNPFQTDALDFDTDFSYHLAPANKEGWIFLQANSTDANSDSYVFGYSKKLSPEKETVTLFDKVQLKSFINGEVSGKKTISVQPYAIQAEGLTADGLSDNYNPDETISLNDLKVIYQVIQNRGEAAEN